MQKAFLIARWWAARAVRPGLYGRLKARPDEPARRGQDALTTAGGTLRLRSGQAAGATVVFPQPV